MRVVIVEYTPAHSIPHRMMLINDKAACTFCGCPLHYLFLHGITDPRPKTITCIDNGKVILRVAPVCIECAMWEKNELEEYFNAMEYLHYMIFGDSSDDIL